jgi:hypothetical protein
VLIDEASGGNPSAVTTALIALGGAIMGGLITAGAQIWIEGHRWLWRMSEWPAAWCSLPMSHTRPQWVRQ